MWFGIGIYVYSVVHDVLVITTFISLFALAIFFIIGGVQTEFDKNDEDTIFFIKWMKRSVITFLISLVLCAFIPSQKTLALILASPIIEKWYVNAIKEVNENNTTLDRIIDKGAKILELELDKTQKAIQKSL